MKSVLEQKGKENSTLTLSKEAAEKIKDLAKRQNKRDYSMKIQVIPGGCAGFQYAMYFEKDPSNEDIIVESRGIRLFLDKKNVDLIKGTRIHYIDNLYGASFKFENPNVKSTCHCGKSFG
ncbi:iron-sulfur cluster assembly accessory protein [Candidatus Woesearchaeota archaeon]|nr:iron-sulfur cluster assembly accessory protein [Candidatus Woesearchaeota archaeon]